MVQMIKDAFTMGVPGVILLFSGVVDRGVSMRRLTLREKVMIEPKSYFNFPTKLGPSR